MKLYLWDEKKKRSNQQRRRCGEPFYLNYIFLNFFENFRWFRIKEIDSMMDKVMEVLKEEIAPILGMTAKAAATAVVVVAVISKTSVDDTKLIQYRWHDVQKKILFRVF